MITAPAYAKLNLALEVLGRRDDGYHEVRTILQTIDLADRLEVKTHGTLRVECADETLRGEANLAWQAAVALARCVNVQPRASIFVHKQVPVGMGLGGGSSDAATTLVALNQLWGLTMTPQQLGRVAEGLGSDVPYFLCGGTALATGRGETISALPPLPAVPVTLVCPNTTIPRKTARLYSCLTPQHYSDGTATRRMEQTLRRGALSEADMYNVFEQVAFAVFPGLMDLRQRFEGAIGRRVHLSGSGPSLFCVNSSVAEHRRVTRVLPSDIAKVYFVHTQS